MQRIKMIRLRSPAVKLVYSAILLFSIGCLICSTPTASRCCLLVGGWCFGGSMSEWPCRRRWGIRVQIYFIHCSLSQSAFLPDHKALKTRFFPNHTTSLLLQSLKRRSRLTNETSCTAINPSSFIMTFSSSFPSVSFGSQKCNHKSCSIIHIHYRAASAASL